jgi:phosphinothricin acetyltransferase
MRIAHAGEPHMAGIAAIYNDAVARTTAIWNDATVDAANRRDWWLQRRDKGYPVLVALDEAGEVLGFASFGDFRAFDGYRFTVEHSVYVRSDARRMGTARALMQGLVADARALGKHALVGAIESGNAASLALHSALGFAEVGRMPQVGAKFGRWLDLTWMQLLLDERPAP